MDSDANSVQLKNHENWKMFRYPKNTFFVIFGTYRLDSRDGGRGQNHDLAGYEVLSLLTNNFNNIDDCLQTQGSTQCTTSKLYLPNINRLRGPKWGLFGSFWPVRLVSAIA